MNAHLLNGFKPRQPQQLIGNQTGQVNKWTLLANVQTGSTSKCQTNYFGNQRIQREKILLPYTTEQDFHFGNTTALSVDRDELSHGSSDGHKAQTD
jgi:hypothetical protein